MSVELLKQYQQDNGLSQAKLATLLGVSPAVISQYLKGEYKGDVDNMDVAGDKMVVKNPKLELGHLMTDYTPAPEDTQSELEALRAEVAELKRRVGANENGGGSFGD